MSKRSQNDHSFIKIVEMHFLSSFLKLLKKIFVESIILLRV